MPAIFYCDYHIRIHISLMNQLPRIGTQLIWGLYFDSHQHSAAEKYATFYLNHNCRTLFNMIFFLSLSEEHSRCFCWVSYVSEEPLSLLTYNGPWPADGEIKKYMATGTRSLGRLEISRLISCNIHSFYLQDLNTVEQEVSLYRPIYINAAMINPLIL
jgi:hypothetical protein